MFKNLENKGNPWGMSEMKRADWTEDLDFEVPVVGRTSRTPEDVEYLFWVGCAGALEDRAKKTTKAVAELLHIAGVKFAVLGRRRPAPVTRPAAWAWSSCSTCSPSRTSRRSTRPRSRRSSRPARTASTPSANEYPQLGGTFEVVHHTQLLASWSTRASSSPVTPIEEKITYHDPCFLGRHNKVYAPPRDSWRRCRACRPRRCTAARTRGFCCGAGGARMWMEERIGKRINTERVDEALTTDPDTSPPPARSAWSCWVTRSTRRRRSGEAKESLEVVDVAQLLIKSIKGQPVGAS